MDILKEKIQSVFNLELSAKKIVEGTISGLHKSPFHGFSTEFMERRPYNNGESTRFLDWKYLAKTDKKYIRKYEEETNLRCHIVLDISSSMYYPKPLSSNIEESKIGFATLLSASLMQIMNKQRDAIGLSMFSDEIEFYSMEKTNKRHFKTLLGKLESNLFREESLEKTKLYSSLHNLAERFHKRSLIVVISDFVDSDKNTEELFEALKHLSFNKHEIVLFHIIDKDTEMDLNFSGNYHKFIDLENNSEIILDNLDLRDEYSSKVSEYAKLLRFKALQYKMDYQMIDIKNGFRNAIVAYLLQRKKIF
jgi:uncharacterized protein (DUF58 family)